MRAQSSGTGPSASCGYCCPFCPTRGRYPGKIRFIEPQGVNGDRRPVPGATSSGAPRESLANFKDGTMWGLKKVTVDTGAVGSVFGEHSFYRETWSSRRGGRHVANRSSDPSGSLPRSQSSGTGPSASCGYCCPLCHTGGRYPGKIVFTEPQVVHGHRRLVPGAPSSGTPRESQAGTGLRGDCRNVLLVPCSRCQYSGKNRFIEKPGVWRLPTVTGGKISDHGCSPLSLEVR